MRLGYESSRVGDEERMTRWRCVVQQQSNKALLVLLLFSLRKRSGERGGPVLRIELRGTRLFRRARRLWYHRYRGHQSVARTKSLSRRSRCGDSGVHAVKKYSASIQRARCIILHTRRWCEHRPAFGRFRSSPFVRRSHVLLSRSRVPSPNHAAPPESLELVNGEPF